VQGNIPQDVAKLIPNNYLQVTTASDYKGANSMKTTSIPPVQCHLKDHMVHELQKVGFLFTTKFCGDIFTVQFLSPEMRDPSIDKNIPVE